MPINPMILEQIRTNDPSLTDLCLKDNKIDAQGAEALADALKVNTSLMSLDLSDNKIYGSGIKALADALKINTSLTSLNLEYNKIGIEGAKALADILMVSTSLASFNLCLNHIGDEGVRVLADALKVNTSLTSLNLDYNKIGYEGAKALADALMVSTSLASLNLRVNRIGGEGAKALADALKVNTSLTSFNLECNQIGIGGAKALAKALIVNISLASLNLYFNQIGIEGAKRLADALKVNTTLTSLNLSCSQNGIEGVKGLADALKVNTTLTNLDLSQNQIGIEGAKALADALKANATLTNLNLSYNKIGFEGARVLVDALKDNITLMSIDLGENSIHSVLPEMNFHTSYRNINISFLLKDCIKVAWVKPVARYSLEDYQTVLSKMNSIFRNVNHVNVSESYEKLIESIYALRLSDNMSEVLLVGVVFERLRSYLSSLSLNLETLPDTSYPSEFARLLSARVNVKNMGDAEAQVMALAALAQPFHDADFREEAKPELIGLLNNRYFANLSEGSVQRRTLDLLTLDLSCQHPYERDLMGFALAAYSRLSGGGKITFDQVMNQLNDRKTVQADFEKLLTKECECKHWSREVLRKKCLEVLTQEFSPAPPRSLSPNPHGLFQPFVAIQSPASENRLPQSKRT